MVAEIESSNKHFDTNVPIMFYCASHTSSRDAPVRKPDTIERLYLDFDGFFASVEQQARPALRGRPVGVVPFEGTNHTCVIACSKEAKAFGVKNVMNIKDAKTACPGIVLVPQSPDLYRRAAFMSSSRENCSASRGLLWVGGSTRP